MTRIAIIDREKCIKEKCGYICQKVCPGVMMGQETVTIDKDGYPVISEILCTGCGICPKKCPTNAISIINLAQEIGQPIYQYGINMFRLYGLALPAEGVVGFIGKNGIGKTTALHILSGIIKPNFGDYTKEYDYEQISQKLSIVENQYFKKIQQKSIKISLKPQNIQKISEVFQGKVKDLLQKTLEKENINKITELFELEKILDRDIKQLSGGELQRLAIAIATGKEADIYYFDEPASYLDIEQRLKIAQIIKDLAQRKQLILIEHDLTIFDYLVDFVYIFYGQENAYGIISKIKNARAGINQYLEGYLKEENVRFRNYELKFEKVASEQPRNEIMLTYPNLKKTYPNFEFNAEAGQIYKGEVIGIIGKNSLGKTIFANIISGNLESDMSLDIKNRYKISYKPQYIKPKKDISVLDYIKENKIDGGFFEELAVKLNINSIADKYLDQLSGGELQRVEITKTLSAQADIYILDEPSAFLDIEQRLNLATLIQRLISNYNKCCFVIDHDLLLIDAIANRIIVFEGKSSEYGRANKPENKKDGFNRFLAGLNITLRKDKETYRPRINKPDSRLDREQKEKGQYYFV